MSGRRAAIGSALFLLVAPGTVAGLVPVAAHRVGVAVVALAGARCWARCCSRRRWRRC